MKKISNLPESSFLKLFYGLITLCFLAGAVCLPDRGNMFAGLWQIITQPCRIATNYFSIGGFSGTLLNMGLVGALSLALLCVTGAKANNTSTLAFLLAVGFSSWGIHILNMWFTVAGVVLYALVKKEPLRDHANAMLFSTGIAPLISELLLRYPNPETVGFHPAGWALALAVGLITGFCLPAGMAHSAKVHKGCDLYSAALPVGMSAFLLQAILYQTMGVKLPGVSGDAAVGNAVFFNVFYCSVFGLCIVLSLLLGGTPKKYWKLLKDPDQVTDFAQTYDNATFLMNAGVYGLMIIGYYNLVGAPLNGVIFGVVMCMLATCNAGSHPGNVWPIMLGYVVASYLFGWLSGLCEGAFAGAINAQAICIGLCYANGLSPIADKYGWAYGMVAAVLHYCMVTTVPYLHGGFCLHNGGMTAALVCLLAVPTMEKMFRTKQEKKLLKTS